MCVCVCACMCVCVSVCRMSTLLGTRGVVEGGDIGSGKCLMRRAAWCLTRPPRLHVLADVRMGRDPPGAVKRRCAGRGFEWMRQRMWHHARHEDQILHRRCIREPLRRAGDETVRRGCRLSSSQAGSESRGGPGVGVAVGGKRGGGKRRVGSDGHVTCLSRT